MAHVRVTSGQQELLRDDLLDACPLLLRRCRRVGAVLGQGHASSRRLGPSVAIDTVDSAIDSAIDAVDEGSICDGGRGGKFL